MILAPDAGGVLPPAAREALATYVAAFARAVGILPEGHASIDDGAMSLRVRWRPAPGSSDEAPALAVEARLRLAPGGMPAWPAAVQPDFLAALAESFPVAREEIRPRAWAAGGSVVAEFEVLP